jgi:hypothetical protein
MVVLYGGVTHALNRQSRPCLRRADAAGVDVRGCGVLNAPPGAVRVGHVVERDQRAAARQREHEKEQPSARLQELIQG